MIKIIYRFISNLKLFDTIQLRGIFYIYTKMRKQVILYSLIKRGTSENIYSYRIKGTQMIIYLLLVNIYIYLILRNIYE